MIRVLPADRLILDFEVPETFQVLQADVRNGLDQPLHVEKNLIATFKFDQQRVIIVGYHTDNLAQATTFLCFK